MATATSGDRPTGGAPDSAPRPDPALTFGDALGCVERSGGYPDTLGGTLGDAAGGMIGGMIGQPAVGDPLVTDTLGSLEGGYLAADTRYRDALSEPVPPAGAAAPAGPDSPAEPAAPVGPAVPAAPGRRKPAPPDGVLRPPGWRPTDRPQGRSRGRSQGRPGDGGPRSATQATVRGAGRVPGIPPGTVPSRVSRSAADLPSGNGSRWVGRGILALVVAGLVIGNVVHGCASGLTGH